MYELVERLMIVWIASSFLRHWSFSIFFLKMNKFIIWWIKLLIKKVMRFLLIHLFVVNNQWIIMLKNILRKPFTFINHFSNKQSSTAFHLYLFLYHHHHILHLQKMNHQLYTWEEVILVLKQIWNKPYLHLHSTKHHDYLIHHHN